MPSGRSTPSWRCTTWRRWPTGALTQARFYLTAAAGLAVVALLLAGMIGIYGVLAYAVTQRTRELGIQIALGADAAGLVRMVSMRGLGLALTGLAVGGAPVRSGRHASSTACSSASPAATRSHWLPSWCSSA